MKGNRSPVVLLIGGIAATMIGITRHNVYEVIFVMGIALFVAWLVQASRPRYAGSGTMLLAIGLTVEVAAHVDVGPYVNVILFVALGTGLLIIGKAAPRAVTGAGVTLMMVAAAYWAIIKAPTLATGTGIASHVFTAFTEGWAFGLALTVVGVVGLIRH